MAEDTPIYKPTRSASIPTSFLVPDMNITTTAFKPQEEQLDMEVEDQEEYSDVEDNNCIEIMNRYSELNDDAAYEAAANAIAEKVRRQQEGKESALLPSIHHDEDFKTVDEIQALLKQQVGTTLSSLKARKTYGRSFYSSSTTYTISATADISNEVSEEIGQWYTERAKYIPLRLTYEEHKTFRLISSILKGSEYTDVVDGIIYKNETKRLNVLMKAIAATLTGMTVALGGDHDVHYQENTKIIQKVFEIGRRYKVMNPEKMRNTYGKLVFMLQDSMLPEIIEMLGFECVIPIQTVYDKLEKGGALDALKSEYIAMATMEILPDNKTRDQIQREIKAKEYAIDFISKKFQSQAISRDDIKQCLHSIGDNSSFLNSNCRPVDQMIQYLKLYFDPKDISNESRWSLAIYGGENGSRLTHDHARQYHYVLQSLTLWREIVHDLFRLWYLSEQDLLDKTNRYKLKDTGQGFNRLQKARRTHDAMHSILYAVQQRLCGTVDGWVGSSVIHLGDSNVPNSLVFIDKYNQVSRILNPIVQCLNQIDLFVMKDPGLSTYVYSKYGSAEVAKRTILHDFFRVGFDGSGADNFFEAGSCIDGRLTSAWNWCQDLNKKDYFQLFKLGGFLGFDGSFHG